MIANLKEKLNEIDKKRLFKFAVIGGTGLGINTLILYLLENTTNLHEMIYYVIAGTIVALYNYLGNHYWTFKDRRHSSHATGGSKFVVMQAGYYAYYYTFVYLFRTVIGLDFLLTPVIVVIIGFILKYLVSTLWIWKHQDENAPVEK